MSVSDKETVTKTTQKGLEVCEVGGFQFARKRKPASQVTENVTVTDQGCERHLISSNSEHVPHFATTIVDAPAGDPSPKKRCLSQVSTSGSNLEDVLENVRFNVDQLLQSLPSDYPLSDKLQAIVTCGLLSASSLYVSSQDDTLAGSIKPILDRFSQILQIKVGEYQEGLETGVFDGLSLRAQPVLLSQLLNTDKIENLLQMRLERLELEAQQWQVQRCAELSLLPPPGGNLSPSEPSNEAASPGAPGGMRSMDAVLRDASSSAVVSLEALMGRARDATRRADEACRELQADLHRELSAPFRHINSPAWLIKSLSRVSEAAAPAAERGVLKSQ